MSNNNLDDMMHIIRKINFFLGMSVQDIDHLNYGEEEKGLLKTILNLNGQGLLNSLAESAVMIDRLSKSRVKIPKWNPEEVKLEDIQKEWNKVFLNVKETGSSPTNPISEGQTSKKDDEPPFGDSRPPEVPEGEKGPFS